jgi:hypothetical protein
MATHCGNKLIAAVIGLALIAPAAHAGGDRGPWIIGVGTRTCGTFVNDLRMSRRAPGSVEASYVFMEVSWVQGFLAAENAEFIGQLRAMSDKAKFADKDLLLGLDADAFKVWLENYCQAHPLDHLFDAANALTTELVGRQFK